METQEGLENSGGWKYSCAGEEYSRGSEEVREEVDRPRGIPRSPEEVRRDSAEVKCSFVDGGRGYWGAEDIALSG